MTQHAAEPSCPVPLELLALLLRCNAVRRDAILDELPDAQRAVLAIYCFDRYHMRRLGFAVALRCSDGSLEVADGAAGRHLAELARSMAGADAGRAQSARPKVAAPARIAA